jgi:hypothetical protein
MVRCVERPNPDLIEIDLPLHPRQSSKVRALAAAVAADAGFSVDDIDDFRLGVNEAVAVLSDVDAGPDARMHLTFEVDGRTVRVVAARRGVGGVLGDDDIDGLARRILTVVLDGFRIVDGAFVIEKRATTDES